MFDLTKAEAQLLDIADKQFQNTVNEAEFLRAVRIAAILESHGVHGDTAGRFVRNGPNGVTFIAQHEEAVGSSEPASNPEE